jgi:hypothetical protein
MLLHALIQDLQTDMPLSKPTSGSLGYPALLQVAKHATYGMQHM